MEIWRQRLASPRDDKAVFLLAKWVSTSIRLLDWLGIEIPKRSLHHRRQNEAKNSGPGPQNGESNVCDRLARTHVLHQDGGPKSTLEAGAIRQRWERHVPVNRTRPGPKGKMLESSPGTPRSPVSCHRASAGCVVRRDFISYPVHIYPGVARIPSGC